MRLRLVLTALVVAVGLAALAQASAAGGGADAVPGFGHVFVIIGENTDYQHLTPTNAPYLMTTIRPSSAWFENYYAATHWSQANYVALTSGQFTPCEQKDLGYACRDDVDNLFHQLDDARMSWKVWLESGTAKCDTGSGGSCTSNVPCPLTGFYTTGNPPIDYTDISYEECLADDVPAGTPQDGMSTFNADLSGGNVADFNLVVPNGCDDGEAACKPLNDRYTQFDAFLAREVPLIEASPAFGEDGVIVVTYDEDQRMGGLAAKNGLGSGGRIATALISPLVQPGDYAATTYSYSLLRTIQDGYGLGPYLGAAAQVGPLPVVWK
ncbi:MAG TPA: alkaline phosphatase family protein [Gaiellaceae bacterium]|nr:alkaline phosphatase family protein [Gaiellaceae bacterium]